MNLSASWLIWVWLVWEALLQIVGPAGLTRGALLQMCSHWAQDERQQLLR